MTGNLLKSTILVIVGTQNYKKLREIAKIKQCGFFASRGTCNPLGLLSNIIRISLIVLNAVKYDNKFKCRQVYTANNNLQLIS